MISVTLQKQMPWGVSYLQEVFLKNSQISLENICVGVYFLMKFQPWGLFQFDIAGYCALIT